MERLEKGIEKINLRLVEYLEENILGQKTEIEEKRELTKLPTSIIITDEATKIRNKLSANEECLFKELIYCLFEGNITDKLKGIRN